MSFLEVWFLNIEERIGLPSAHPLFNPLSHQRRKTTNELMLIRYNHLSRLSSIRVPWCSLPIARPQNHISVPILFHHYVQRFSFSYLCPAQQHSYQLIALSTATKAKLFIANLTSWELTGLCWGLLLPPLQIPSWKEIYNIFYWICFVVLHSSSFSPMIWFRLMMTLYFINYSSTVICLYIYLIWTEYCKVQDHARWA